MWTISVYFLNALLLLNLLDSINGWTYDLDVWKDDLFSSCRNISSLTNMPRKVLDISAMFDLTELQTKQLEFEIRVSGNATLVWDVKPTDRIQAEFYMFERKQSEWLPTRYFIKIDNFCGVMYDSKQPWYTYWSQYISNRVEVERKCINTPGTKFEHKTFDLKPEFDNPDFIEGILKFVHIFKAYDIKDKLRPNVICFETIGTASDHI